MTKYEVKTLGHGMRLDGIPPRAVLDHPDAPEDLAPALADFEAASAEFSEKEQERAAAESSVIRESTRATMEEKQKEARAAVTKEAEAARVAMQAGKAAGRKVAALLEEDEDALRALAARIGLEAHARRVDAEIEAHAAGKGFEVAPSVGRVPWLPAHDSHGSIAEAAGRRTVLESLDLVNAHALADLAGDRCGLVEVVSASGDAAILTTERRAEQLTSAVNRPHGREWVLAGEEGA